jgi:hypothetical protein
MNPFLESPSNRIRLWRSFRKNLKAELSDCNQLNNIVEFFSKAPESALTIDVESPETWLTPWELLYRGDFCSNSIAYLMEQTLLYSDCQRWTSDRIRLVLVNDFVSNILKIIVIVDNKYALNYEYNKIIDWGNVVNNCAILNEYKFNSASKTHSIL